MEKYHHSAVIAVISTHANRASIVGPLLKRHELTTLHFRSCAHFLQHTPTNAVDLIIIEGYTLTHADMQFLKSFRDSENARVPILVIAGNNDEALASMALRAGADDFMRKPLRQSELLARIEKSLRQTLHPKLSRSTFGVFEFLVDQRQLYFRNQLARLRPREFDLLLCLFQNEGQVVTRDVLLMNVWQTVPSLPTRSIDTYVSRLRKRFGLDGSSGWILSSVYQRGYCMMEAQENHQNSRQRAAEEAPAYDVTIKRIPPPKRG